MLYRAHLITATHNNVYDVRSLKVFFFFTTLNAVARFRGISYYTRRIYVSSFFFLYRPSFVRPNNTVHCIRVIYILLFLLFPCKSQAYVRAYHNNGSWLSLTITMIFPLDFSSRKSWLLMTTALLTKAIWSYWLLTHHRIRIRDSSSGERTRLLKG